TPEELLELTGAEHLEDAYVSLTMDVAREDEVNEKPLGRWSKAWRSMFTPSIPKEVDEDE
ncbi:MAG: hypothetical protein ISP84_05005, partial [Candidatus Poseidonia sp.]|nr:hypothetical protein [Poseidonia sp.]